MSIQASLSRWFALHTFVALSIVCFGVYVTTQWSFEDKQEQEQEFLRHQAIVRRVVLETTQPLDLESLRHKMADYFVSHSNVSVSLRTNTQILYQSDSIAAGDAWRVKDSRMPTGTVDGEPLLLRMSLDIGSDNSVPATAASISSRWPKWPSWSSPRGRTRSVARTASVAS